MQEHELAFLKIRGMLIPIQVSGTMVSAPGANFACLIESMS